MNQKINVKWRIDMLGGFRASCATYCFDRLKTRKTEALLARLAYYPHQKHTREELIDMLWPEVELTEGRKSLSQALFMLRPHLEPPGVAQCSILIADRRFVALNSSLVTTDVAEFRELIARAKAAPETQAALYSAAADLYHGSFLPGHYEEWALIERQNLLGEYLLVLRALIEESYKSGAGDEAITYARKALEADPYAEDFHCELMRLLAADGDVPGALRQYRDLENLLSKGLGQTPSPSTQALYEEILGSYSEKTLNSTQIESYQSASLPSPSTRFFGRDDELALLDETLSSELNRIVTITGVGGSGKTRLVIEAAHRMIDRYLGRVYYVSLVDASEFVDIERLISEAVGVRLKPSGAACSQIAAELAKSPSLIILDNFEHLVENSASAFSELVEEARGSKFLITSRVRLGLIGEQEIPLQPLPAPAASSSDVVFDQAEINPSLSIFVDRARAVRPSFSLDASNYETVAEICRRVDGLPLAIELCAAWVHILSPTQLLDRLSNRLDILVSRRRNIPARHRSFRAAVEGSYLNLTPSFRHYFARLSVFRNGWTLEALEGLYENEEPDVASSLVHILTELCERSLVISEPGEGSEMRYRMLETLREYAAEQLSFAETLRWKRAHARYYLKLGEIFKTSDVSPHRAEILTRLDHEHQNLRSALQWTLDSGEIELGMNLAVTWQTFWFSRGLLRDGVQWLRWLLGAPRKRSNPPLQLLGQTWSALGYLIWCEGNYREALDAHNQALEMRQQIGDREGEAESLLLRGITFYRRAEYDEALTDLQSALTIAEELGNRAFVARALLNLGNVTGSRGELDATEAYYERSLAVFQEIGHPTRVATILNNLGVVALRRGELEKALGLLEKARSFYKQEPDSLGQLMALVNLGSVTCKLGNYGAASSYLRPALTKAQQLGDMYSLTHCLYHLGQLFLCDKKTAKGLYCLSASLHQCETTKLAFESSENETIEQLLQSARQALSKTDFEAAWLNGRMDSLDMIVSNASEWV